MADNVAEIRRRMAQAASAAGRRSEEVLLCAACKHRHICDTSKPPRPQFLRTLGFSASR